MNPDQGASSRALICMAIVTGVLIGIEEMIALFHLVPVPTGLKNPDLLTELGMDMIRPERDIPVYLGGCLLSAVLGLGLAWFWKWRLRKLEEDRRAVVEWQKAASLSLMALGSLLIYEPILYLVRSRYTPSGIGPVLSAAIVLPGLITLLAAMIAHRFWVFGKWMTVVIQRLFRDGQDENGELVPDGRPGSWIRDGVWFLGISLVIIAMLYVPSYQELSGRFADDMTPFHHWDYFVMGPALGYFHGGKLGTEVYTQYGVGYPMIVSWLSPILPLSYSNLTLMSVVYAIVYFIGLAVCLRIALRDRVWATTGVLLAINLQVFRGVFPNASCWISPSATILRYPMDVWFFLSILLHLRTGRWIWAMTAGLATGLGLLFITDSGFYLITLLLFYLGVWSLHEWYSGRRLVPILGTSLGSLASMILMIVAGLMAASRGSLFERGFIPALFEALITYSGGGMSAYPITSKSAVGFGNMFMFSLACFVALTTLTLLFFRGLRFQARADLIFGGCVAAYGLEILIQYVNRSVGMNLYHMIIPFCLLVVGHVARVAGSVGPGVGRWLARGVPLALVVGSIVINPLFRDYPGLIYTAIHGPLPRGLCLFDNVRGLAEHRVDFIRQVREVTGRMTQLHQSGYRVMVLDSSDPMFYLMSGVKPGDRYTPFLLNFLNKDQLARAKLRVADAHFDYLIFGKFGYVNIQGQSDFYATLPEARSSFTEIAERDYVLTERIGPYSIWRSRRLESQHEPGPVIGEQPSPTSPRAGVSTGRDHL